MELQQKFKDNKTKTLHTLIEYNLQTALRKWRKNTKEKKKL